MLFILLEIMPEMALPPLIYNRFSFCASLQWEAELSLSYHNVHYDTLLHRANNDSSEVLK